MCHLIESVKINNGIAENLFWHNKRLNESRRLLYGIQEEIRLESFIHVPGHLQQGEVKCRILYGKKIDTIEFKPYVFRPVRSLKIVTDNYIKYEHKYRDRSHINMLFEQKGECDDILIVKNGLVRESSYCNVVFRDGNESFTPASPLLRGTKRAKHLLEGKIIEKEIKIEEIPGYQYLYLINAFLDLGRCVISTKNIF